jgi:hypothetical protein
MGSADTLDHAGFIVATSTQNGQENWRVILPLEDPTVWNPGVGMDGFNQFPSTRVRFTPNNQTAYIHTATATGDDDTSRSFLYSLTTGAGVPPTPTPRTDPSALSGTNPNSDSAANSNTNPNVASEGKHFRQCFVLCFELQSPGKCDPHSHWHDVRHNDIRWFR